MKAIYLATCLLLVVSVQAASAQTVAQVRRSAEADLDARLRQINAIADRNRLREFKIVRLMWQRGMTATGCTDAVDLLGLPKGVGRIRTIAPNGQVTMGTACRTIPEQAFTVTSPPLVPTSGSYNFRFDSYWQPVDIELQFDGAAIKGEYTIARRQAWDTARRFDEVLYYHIEGHATKCYRGTVGSCYLFDIDEESRKGVIYTRPMFRLFVTFNQDAGGQWRGIGQQTFNTGSDGRMAQVTVTAN